MSYADTVFKDLCTEILTHGTSTAGEAVRPHWPDGADAHTIKAFGQTAVYDVGQEFPALTLRRTALKSCMDEILWIYQKKSNVTAELNSHIWDEWTGADGTIGKAYGYQIGRKSSYPEGEMDQMDRVLWQLRHTPFSRRIMTSTYTFADLSEMNLYPCAWNVTYSVTRANPDPEGTADTQGPLVLNMILNQRSQDVLVANNWNVCQYAILLMMVARASSMEVGRLVHVIADAHIYDRHVPLVRELLSREPYPAPRVRLNPEVTDFYAFTPDDLIVEDYQTHPSLGRIPVAV